MSCGWVCSVCGSRSVRVVPAGGPFGRPSRPVSGLWVSCLSCFRWVFVPFPVPLRLSSVLPCCGVFRHDETPSHSAKKPATEYFKTRGYTIDKETGEILSSPQPSVTSKVLDHVLGPKASQRGTLARKAHNTKPLSGWKRAFACVILAALAISIFLISIGVISTPYDRIAPTNLDCTREWVPDVGWVQSCE